MIVVSFFVVSFISTLVLWSLCRAAKKAEENQPHPRVLQRGGSEFDATFGEPASVLRMRRRETEIRDAIFRSPDTPDPRNV